MKHLKIILNIIFFIAIISFTVATSVFAQRGDITYTVQVGDTLSEIALKYNMNITELAVANGIVNPDLIFAGRTLTIPMTDDNAASVESVANSETYTVQPGDTLGVIAARFGMRTTRLAQANAIADINLISVGQKLLIPDNEITTSAIPLPAPFESITFSENPIIQGRTLVVYVTLATTATLTADFETRPVYLASDDGIHYWGLVGIHALSEIGVYSLAFNATLPDGTQSAVAQNVIVSAGPYDTETIIVEAGREGLLSPDVIHAEAAKMSALWNQVSPEKQWDGVFSYPVANPRLTSDFGTRRSYGGGPVNGYHAGTDFGGNGEPIYAPAAGTVVLAEPLNVRGNAVLLDHGMGVFSGYWHQTEIIVNVGDHLEKGDLIGYIGNTGLVTGPHLHWEMRVGGIAVEPLQWLEQAIPAGDNGG